MPFSGAGCTTGGCVSLMQEGIDALVVCAYEDVDSSGLATVHAKPNQARCSCAPSSVDFSTLFPAGCVVSGLSWSPDRRSSVNRHQVQVASLQMRCPWGPAISHNVQADRELGCSNYTHLVRS
jgi:hypothetical protein